MLRALACVLLLIAGPVSAASTDVVRGNAVEGRLISVENGVGPGGATVSAGLHLILDEGWKTYWRSPGEVGLPPELSWEGSRNVASAALSYPAPTRFEAFDIQNFGYGGEVVFPVTVMLEEAGVPARLALRANLLVCADICVPETLEFALDLPAAAGIDGDAAALLSDWTQRVPATGADAGVTIEAAHLDEAALTVLATSPEPFVRPDIFPEHGDWASFGAPEIMLADGGRTLHAVLPVMAPGNGALAVTVVDGDRAATLAPVLSAEAPAVPVDGTTFLASGDGTSPPSPAGGATGPAPGGGATLWAMVLVAALGGLILNVMPCVLPVLSMKLAGALAARDRSRAEVRTGFLASAAGVMTFFLGLALAVMAARSAGLAVGWGVQFQQPVFLALMIGLITIFAANMLGLFRVGLGSGAMTALARTGPRGGPGADFATGMLAAVMATPCSAPFIGTAVTYALTHGPVEIAVVFAAMGLGLSLPYLAVAGFPGLIRHLPRPGPWMVTVQRLLGGVLLLTAGWLLTVLAGSAGWPAALVVGALAVAVLAGLALGRGGWAVAGAGLVAVMAAAVLVPVPDRAVAGVDAGWEAFDIARVASEVAAGNVVFVDVTADWCLTCKANKRLVLERGSVAAALEGTVALQADWTRPDAAIAAYLEDNDRFGIPFDAVYGPGAPEGIVLPELLTEGAVLEAIDRAGD